MTTSRSHTPAGLPEGKNDGQPSEMPANKRFHKPGPIRRLLGACRRILVTLVVGLVAGMALMALYLLIMWLRLPAADELDQDGNPGKAAFPTAFMREAGCQGEALEHQYVPLEAIDPRLGCTVVWSEDPGFFDHQGVDWRALQSAWERNREAGEIRSGGSTIPMQLARNLYLTRARTPSRKLAEMVLASRLVGHYERLRVLELYLNTVELGPCVYGVEAAAQHYFGHSARVLDLAEATFLAAMLPRPSRPPGVTAQDKRQLIRQQHRLLGRLVRAGLIPAATSRSARAEVMSLWGTLGRRHRPTTDQPAPARWYGRQCGAARPKERG